jgi:drug/metabolite transporter (DMT)-like permease
MNTGYIDAIIFLVVFTIAIYIFSFLLKKINPLLVTCIEIIVGSFLILLYLLFVEKVSFWAIFTTPSKGNYLWLSSAGFLGFFGGNYFSLINLKEGNAGTNSLLAPLITIVSSVLAIYFLNEKLRSNAIIGIIITSSSALYFLANPSKSKKVNSKSLMSGLISVLLISLSIVFSIKGVFNSSISLFHSIFIKLITMLPLAIVFFVMQVRVKILNSIYYKIILLIPVVILLQTFLANYFWLRASLKLGTATFQIIIALLPFCIGLVDSLLLKKKQLDRTFYLSATIATIGIFIFFFL